MKRLLIATFSGLACGFICYGFASGSGELALPIALQIIFSRMLIGFAIGLSAVKMGLWPIHGLVLGFVFSLPLAFSGLMAPDNPEFSKAMRLISTVVLGMIYGLLIELVTSVLFKARQV